MMRGAWLQAMASGAVALAVLCSPLGLCAPALLADAEAGEPAGAHCPRAKRSCPSTPSLKAATECCPVAGLVLTTPGILLDDSAACAPGRPIAFPSSAAPRAATDVLPHHIAPRVLRV